MTPEIERMILEKAKIYQRYVKQGGSIAYYQILRDITSRCKNAIKGAESNYFSRFGESLNDSAITPKNFWQSYIGFYISAKCQTFLQYVTITRF